MKVELITESLAGSTPVRRIRLENIKKRELFLVSPTLVNFNLKVYNFEMKSFDNSKIGVLDYKNVVFEFDQVVEKNILLDIWFFVERGLMLIIPIGAMIYMLMIRKNGQ